MGEVGLCSVYLRKQHSCKVFACADANLDVGGSTSSDVQRLGMCF